MNKFKILQVNHLHFSSEIENIVNTAYSEEFEIYIDGYKCNKYDRSSVHFVAEIENEFIGYIRVIEPEKYGLPAFEVTKPEIEIDLNTCVEFSRFIVIAGYRKFYNIGLNLMQKAFNYVLEAGYDNIIADVFLEGRNNTYTLFKSLGFDELSKPYRDYRYKDKLLSVLLMLNLSKTICNFSRQKIFLENLDLATINKNKRKYIRSLKNIYYTMNNYGK